MTETLTATLDLTRWVEVLSFSPDSASAFVRDEDGDEFEVSVSRLDNVTPEELDLLPLEA